MDDPSAPTQYLQNSRKHGRSELLPCQHTLSCYTHTHVCVCVCVCFFHSCDYYFLLLRRKYFHVMDTRRGVHPSGRPRPVNNCSIHCVQHRPHLESISTLIHLIFLISFIIISSISCLIQSFVGVSATLVTKRCGLFPSEWRWRSRCCQEGRGKGPGARRYIYRRRQETGPDFGRLPPRCPPI